jgi:hypothetical protein
LLDGAPIAMTQRPSARAALVVVVGLVVGALTSIGQTYLHGPLNAFVNSASAWLVAPFVVGATMRTRLGAAVAGLVVCLFQLLGYYATAQARGYPAAHSLIVFWTACAVVGGPVFGAAGKLWRSGPFRGLGASVLAAAFLAEGLWVYAHELHYRATAALWLGIGAAIAAVLLRPPRELGWLALTVPVGVVAELALRGIYAQTF